MRRSRIIAIAILLAAFGAAMPIAAVLYVSWNLAVGAEQERLSTFANRAITRANRSLGEISGALRAMTAFRGGPCSTDHIAEMRRLTMNTSTVEEIGYFENGRLKCTSWGVTESDIPYAHGDYTTNDGIEVTIRMQPLVTGSKDLMALQYKSYNALVDPLRFVDVIVDPGMQLAIASDDGKLIGELNGPDPELLRAIIAQPRNGMNELGLFAVSRANGWMAIAIEPREGMLPNLRRERLMLLPIGAFIGLFIVGVVIWFSRRRLSPVGELEIAIQNREFLVHYQPIVELKTGRCIGGEALVRWRRPDGSLVRPDLFIPLAEETGLIMQITDQVIAIVVADLKKHSLTFRALHVAINVSAADIKTGRILPVVTRELERAGIEPQQIWLEATERGFMDIESARATIALARQLGHSVAIDDFGTGYSSLQYLQGLPLDALKIDKAFVDSIGRNTATSSVITHIIDMAKTLNLQIIAEGVENEVQVSFLRAHQVEFAQGWLFSKPLPVLEFVDFHRRSNGDKAEPVEPKAARKAKG
ncbi:EAL domain-containing protein [Bradyrhizobium jicamae]|uniref:cyclic-guanylate-specific phosphodiesterase n=1 Tax=Bradyrhizobium jicamae TaxID=280332 RepID=A0ABS5FY42_9BRAD|nr:EAL domain-containing protein [Bradyrhizobium jicamae]MBR0801718.1 EAL domain-containing protein [Bradyrhizobium jicamae]MBR0934767.1 EAL domain-containing protein [Bradyrhizobium jicamae]